MTENFTLRIATLNMSTGKDKIPATAEEMKSEKIDILMAQEFRKKGEGIETIDGVTVVHKGIDASDAAKAQAGVAIIVRDHPDFIISNPKYISERILTLHLSVRGQAFVLVNCYAPANKNLDILNRFIGELEFVLAEIEINKPKDAIVVIGGDLNGVVRRSVSNDDDCVGVHGARRGNEKGDAWRKFARENHLFFANTFFTNCGYSYSRTIHKNKRKTMSTRPNIICFRRSLIDYLLLPIDKKHHITNCEINELCALSSDHLPVIATLEFKARKPSENITKTRIAHEKLREKSELWDQLQRIMRDLLATARHFKAEKMWQIFSSNLLANCARLCGVKTIRSKGKQTPWFKGKARRAVHLKKKKFKKLKAEECAQRDGIKAVDEERVERLELEYRAACRIEKQQIKQAKKATSIEIADELHGLKDKPQQAQRLLWIIVNSAKKLDEIEYNQLAIEDENGVVLTDPVEILNRWRRYFMIILDGLEILNDTFVDVSDVANDDDARVELDQVAITREDITAALSKEKEGKAPGLDEIRIEMIRALEDIGIEWLLVLFNKMWRERRVPNDFLRLVLATVPKKGDRAKCNNYRGISLISIIAKCYARILENKLRIAIAPALEECQHGFMQGKGTGDCTFILRQIIEKSVEFYRELFITFMDLEKAYDFVDRSQVWSALEELNVDKQLLANIKALYRDSIAIVRINGKCAEPFRVCKGLRQGCPLSPLLFIAVFNKVCKRIKLEKTGVPLTEDEWLMLLAFADDTGLLSFDRTEMQTLIDIFVDACTELGLKINVPKTKFMVINANDDLDDDVVEPFYIYEQPLEQVDIFTYLGSLMTQDGSCDEDVRARIAKAHKTYGAMKKYIFKNKHVPLSAKMKCLQGVIEPTLRFGCESWALSAEASRSLDVAQMRWLRGIVGVKIIDKIPNKIIREKCGTQKMTTIIARHQLRYYGHVARMAPERLVKQVRYWEPPPDWRRPRGRPKLQYLGGIKKHLNRIGIDSLEEADALAQDRNKWRAQIHTIDDERFLPKRFRRHDNG